MKLRTIGIPFYIFLSLLFVACKPNKPQLENSESSHFVDSLIDISNEQYRKHYNHNNVWDVYLREASAVASKSKNLPALIDVYFVIAKRFRRLSDHDHAMKHLDRALTFAKEIKDVGREATLMHEKAVVYRRMDEHGQALSTYVKTLEMAESVQDTFLIHCAYNGMGNVYFVYKDYETAIDYFHKALRLTKGTNPNLTGQAINMNTLGESWLFRGNLDSALYYLNQSFAINEQIGSEIGKSICYNGLGMVYQAKGEYDKAIESYKSSISIHRHHDELIYAAMIMNSLGETYLLNKNYEEAEEALLEALDVSRNIGSKDNAFKATNNLSALYEARGSCTKALAYNKLGLLYKDSLSSELVEQNTMAVQNLHTLEKQDRELDYLKQEAELNTLKYRKQRNFYIVSSSLGLLLSLFALLLYRQRKLKSQLQWLALEHKLNQVQMNPHFIFNSLSAIQSFVMRSDKFAASDYISNFSRLMRNILEASRTNAISMDNEKEIISDYVALQQLRFNDAFDFSLQINDDISLENNQVPPMMVQPFIENAIEHGFKGIQYQGKLKVSYVKDGASLIIKVDDNGVGLNGEKNSSEIKEHQSLATEITKERLSFIQSLTKHKCSLKIIDKSKLDANEKGVRVELTIPFDY